MSEEPSPAAEKSSSTNALLKGLIYPALLALILGVSKPFWWDLLFPAEKTETVEIVPASKKDSMDVTSPAIKDTVISVAGTDEKKPDQYQATEQHDTVSVTPPPQNAGNNTPLTEETKTPEPPKPVNLPGTYEFEEIGKWGKSIRGDNEMDTEDGKTVLATCNGKLVHDDRTVTLQLHYRVVENKGDRTTFDDTRNIVVWSRNQTPAGKKITDVTSRAGTSSNARKEIRGETHRANPFLNLQNTFFENLKCTVDGPGDNDDYYVGISGRIRFTVVMEDR